MVNETKFEWQTLDDMFETVQYDEPESEEIEEEPEIDDELPEKYWDYEENGYLQKLQPPRPGLVPQTGDYEHPYRWVRPDRPQINSDQPSNLSRASQAKKLASNLQKGLDKSYQAIYGKPFPATISEVKLFSPLQSNEKLLLHGTDFRSVEPILENGLRPSSWDAHLGKGFYFSETAVEAGYFATQAPSWLFQEKEGKIILFAISPKIKLVEDYVLAEKLEPSGIVSSEHARNVLRKFIGPDDKLRKITQEMGFDGIFSGRASGKPKEFKEFVLFNKTDFVMKGVITLSKRGRRVPALQKFQDLFEKSRVAYHEHDGWQEHPVRVGDHQKYFAGEDDRSIERTPEKQWPILISTKKIPEESIKKVFSEIPQKWQDLIYEDPTPLEVKENTRTNGGLYSGHVISINPILFLYGSAKVESTYPGVKGDNFGEIVLLHEFGHAVFSSLIQNDVLRMGWADASRDYSKWKNQNLLITKYSTKDAHEFFAECVVYYLRAPKILKQIHPTVFAFFDKYFSKQSIEKQDIEETKFEPGLGAWWFETEEGFDKLLEENKELEEEIEKGARPGLVARKVKVYPEKGNDYWAIRWVRPEKGFEEYENLLSVDEKRALTNYKQFNALLLNNFLRGGYKEGNIVDLSKIPDYLKEKAKEAQEKGFFYQQEMNLMDAAFDKVPPLENDAIVYRGIRKVAFEDKLGKIFIDPAYVSVTSDINIAKRFGDVVKIKLPKGTKVIPMDPLGPLVMQKEKEFLLPRNKKFTVAKDENDEIMLELHNE